MRDKVTRHCSQTTTVFEEKGEPKRNRAEALLSARLTAKTKPALKQFMLHAGLTLFIIDLNLNSARCIQHPTCRHLDQVTPTGKELPPSVDENTNCCTLALTQSSEETRDGNKRMRILQSIDRVTSAERGG